MTDLAVSPVIPPTAHAGLDLGPRTHSAAGAQPRRAIPLPQFAALRIQDTIYGLARIDCHGRIADPTIVRVLSWLPGTLLDIRERGGLVLVTADGQGVFAVTGQGHLRLPATVRRRCGLVAGDRVLLSADSATGPG
jgi:hypothetical protein